MSQSTVSAPKRLLQFAVRDAVATSRQSNATAEPSVKRLRSVVSTTDSYAEVRPQRIHRASMSAAIKAMAEAVKDVTKVRPSRNVFDRLGNAMNGPNSTSHHDYGVVTEDADDVDFNVEMENVHSSYHPQNDTSRLQEGNMSTFHGEVLDTGLAYEREGYDDFGLRGLEAPSIYPSGREGYDDVGRRREATETYPSGTSGGSWVESSLKYQYSANDHIDGPPHRPHSATLKKSSFVSTKMRKPQYQEEVEAAEVDNRQIMRGVDTVSTKSESWLMKENNNHPVAFNGNVRILSCKCI